MNQRIIRKIANEIVSGLGDPISVKEYTLQELSNGIEFIPKYHGGLNFIIKDKKIYKRGPSASDNFVEIRLRDMPGELRFREQDDVVNAIEYFSGNYDKLIKDLKDTNKFHIKIIKNAEEKDSRVPGGGGSHSYGGLGDYKSIRDKIMEEVVPDIKKSHISPIYIVDKFVDYSKKHNVDISEDNLADFLDKNYSNIKDDKIIKKIFTELYARPSWHEYLHKNDKKSVWRRAPSFDFDPVDIIDEFEADCKVHHNDPSEENLIEFLNKEYKDDAKDNVKRKKIFKELYSRPSFKKYWAELFKL